MPIRVYNTLSRTKETFEPVTPGKVGIYCCGPTVYSLSHVGHMVGPVIFDTVKRYLVYNGFDVKLVINITDIDDKIINRAAEEKCAVDALARRVADDYVANLKRLGVSVDHMPRATEHIAEIQAMIVGLVARGFAYAAGGDVYFDVTKDHDYGKLSNRKLDELLAGTRKEVSDLKRNPGDFALWKGAKLGEPAWESPWGPGRPGWHIECSAMSMKLLGETFDIHGGGLDLCFPHHEDEIAQSESFTGKLFAKYWMHNGLMQRSDETRKLGAREGDYSSQEENRMGKSKGNALVISELLTKFAPETVRFFLLSTHYRRPIDFSPERLDEVGKGLARFHAFCERLERATGQSFYGLTAPRKRGPAWFAADGSEFLAKVLELRDRYLECMDDDFNTGGAIGILFELLPVLNRFADEKKLETPTSGTDADRDQLRKAAGVLRELTNILGVLTAAPQPSAATESGGLTPALMELLLDLRQELRKAKNYSLADTIRQRLAKLGITIEDRSDGSRWKIGT